MVGCYRLAAMRRPVTESVPGHPLVSVVIPMFNAGPWIREALMSVATQTHPVHECIVVDDGSTDDGPDIVRGVQRGGTLPLTLIEIEHAGVSVARNTGIDNASGFYIALLDSDDVWNERKLEYQLETMQRTEANMCTTGYVLFDSETRRVRGVVSVRRLDRAIRRWLALEGNGLAISSTAIFRRSDIEHGKDFDPRISVCEDVEFTLRMHNGGKLVVDGRVLVGLRNHAAQAHRDHSKHSANMVALYDLLPIEKFGSSYAKRCRSNLHAHLGYSLLARGRLVDAASSLACALRRDPFRLVTLPLHAVCRRIARRLRVRGRCSTWAVADG